MHAKLLAVQSSSIETTENVSKKMDKREKKGKTTKRQKKTIFIIEIFYSINEGIWEKHITQFDS